MMIIYVLYNALNVSAQCCHSSIEGNNNDYMKCADNQIHYHNNTIINGDMPKLCNMKIVWYNGVKTA